MEPILVLITVGDAAEAQRIETALLDARLVACVNRIEGVRSTFWWKGELDRAGELLLVAKTRRDLWSRVLEAVRVHHSYEVFEAIALPIVEGNPDYLRWIEESTVTPC